MISNVFGGAGNCRKNRQSKSQAEESAFSDFEVVHSAHD
jgi:hypothetical protein